MTRLTDWVERKLRERYEPWTLHTNETPPPVGQIDWWQAKVNRTLAQKHPRQRQYDDHATNNLFDTNTQDAARIVNKLIDELGGRDLL